MSRDLGQALQEAVARRRWYQPLSTMVVGPLLIGFLFAVLFLVASEPWRPKSQTTLMRHLDELLHDGQIDMILIEKDHNAVPFHLVVRWKEHPKSATYNYSAEGQKEP